jgi:hypothetical protein
MTMKKFLFYLFCILIFLNPLHLSAQEEEPDVRDMSTRERIFVGGFIGMQFGTITSVNVSPIVGYRITNRLSAGIGGTYQYHNDRSFGQSFTTSIYGGGLFARFRVVDQVFLHAEYERLSLESFRFGGEVERARFWEDNYFLGVGYRLRLGERVFFNIIVLYNFNQDSQAYFQNPILRFGVDVGL